MINKEAAAKLVEFAKAVQKYANAGDKENPTLVSVENRRRAWVLLEVLSEYAGHLEQSDMFHTLAELPRNSLAEQKRCAKIAKAEDAALMKAQRQFEKHLQEFKEKSAGAAVKLELTESKRKPAPKKSDGMRLV